MSFRVRSIAQNPNPGSNIDEEEYTGPSGGGTSYQSEYRTSAQHATAFETSALAKTSGKPLGISSQTNKGVFSFDSGASTPGFNQNK
jgi:hypothetical protein